MSVEEETIARELLRRYELPLQQGVLYPLSAHHCYSRLSWGLVCTNLRYDKSVSCLLVVKFRWQVCCNLKAKHLSLLMKVEKLRLVEPVKC
jgi:hypothetical protein